MYLNGKTIKRLMARLGWSRSDLATYAYIHEITVWKIISKEKYSTTSEVGMKLYRVFKVEGVITHPEQLLDVELMDRESIKLAR